MKKYRIGFLSGALSFFFILSSSGCQGKGEEVKAVRIAAETFSQETGFSGSAHKEFAGNVFESDEEAIISTLKAMWGAIEKGDVEEYGSYIHPDFTAFGENDVYLAQGKELEMRMMSGYLKRATDVHTEMHQPEVIVRGDVAWILYYWTDEGWSQGERFTSRGKSTRIFVKEKGKWLCIHGHYTAVS